MRKKLASDVKRNNQIGIKVKTETREKLEYIRKREAKTLSTLINDILEDYIKNYFKIAKIEWSKIPEDEKGETNNGFNNGTSN